jgi:hypothetical protein
MGGFSGGLVLPVLQGLYHSWKVSRFQINIYFSTGTVQIQVPVQVYKIISLHKSEYPIMIKSLKHHFCAFFQERHCRGPAAAEGDSGGPIQAGIRPCQQSPDDRPQRRPTLLSGEIGLKEK